ncbi:MAG: DUF4174 domain-containing protein [Pseudomonadota bacterium]
MPSRRTFTSALAGLSVLPSVAAATLFPEKRWQRRLLVVVASESARDTVERQRALVASPMFSARDLDLVEAVDRGPVRINGDPVASPTVEAVRDHYRVAGDFGVRVIGKDGGVKLTTTRLVTMQALAELIDAMPMRRQEMRERGNEVDEPRDPT